MSGSKGGPWGGPICCSPFPRTLGRTSSGSSASRARRSGSLSWGPRRSTPRRRPRSPTSCSLAAPRAEEPGSRTGGIRSFDDFELRVVGRTRRRRSTTRGASRNAFDGSARQRGGARGAVPPRDGARVPEPLRGFRVPILEAMARRTPVIAADRSSIPEVARGAAILVDPDDVEHCGMRCGASPTTRSCAKN